MCEKRFIAITVSSFSLHAATNTNAIAITKAVATTDSPAKNHAFCRAHLVQQIG